MTCPHCGQSKTGCCRKRLNKYDDIQLPPKKRFCVRSTSPLWQPLLQFGAGRMPPPRWRPWERSRSNPPPRERVQPAQPLWQPWLQSGAGRMPPPRWRPWERSRSNPPPRERVHSGRAESPVEPQRGRRREPGRLRSPSPSPPRPWRPWGGRVEFEQKDSCYRGLVKQVKYLHRGSCDMPKFLLGIKRIVRDEVERYFRQHGAMKIAISTQLGFNNQDSGVYAHIR